MKGLLCKPWKVQAIQDGATVTRRLGGLAEINKEPDKWEFITKAVRDGKTIKTGDCLFRHEDGRELLVKPRYRPNEVVYIKEAWNPIAYFNGTGKSLVEYKLDGDRLEKLCMKSDYDKWFKGGHLDNLREWESPLFMPAWAARIFRKTVDVRHERLQEITGEDVNREGVNYENIWGKFSIPDWDAFVNTQEDIAVRAFAKKWNEINPSYPFESNPYVWRYQFVKETP